MTTEDRIKRILELNKEMNQLGNTKPNHEEYSALFYRQSCLLSGEEEVLEDTEVE